jgi:hypothetical protein
VFQGDAVGDSTETLQLLALRVVRTNSQRYEFHFHAQDQVDAPRTVRHVALLALIASFAPGTDTLPSLGKKGGCELANTTNLITDDVLHPGTLSGDLRVTYGDN